MKIIRRAYRVPGGVGSSAALGFRLEPREAALLAPILRVNLA